MLSADLVGLYESYMNVYNENDDSITEELLEEIVSELVDECIDFGYDIDESISAVELALNEYFESLDDLDEAKVTYGSDTESPEQRSARAQERHRGMKSAARKAAVKGAVSNVKQKAKAIKASAGIAGSIAKDEARRAGRAAAHSVSKSASAVSSAAKKKKEQVKGGVKKLLGKGLRAVSGGAGKVAQAARKAGSAAGKAAERLGEDVEQIAEISADLGLLASKAADRKRSQFAASGNKSAAAAKAAQASRLYKKQAEKRMKIEELDVDIFDLVLEYLTDEGYAETIEEAQFIMSQLDEATIELIVNGEKVDEAMSSYDRNRQRAAQRAAARNEARKQGKTGNVPGVGYVSPRPERETWTDESGRARHKTGARMPNKEG